MLKKVLALVAMLYAAACFAAVDVNKAGAAELDSIKGIGPVMSTKILDERKKGNFKDWNDFITRVKGVGEGNAAKFSAEGMTVSGTPFKTAGATPTAKKDEKKDAKADTSKKEEKKDTKAAEPKKDEKEDIKAEPAKPAASAAKK